MKVDHNLEIRDVVVVVFVFVFQASYTMYIPRMNSGWLNNTYFVSSLSCSHMTYYQHPRHLLKH